MYKTSSDCPICGFASVKRYLLCVMKKILVFLFYKLFVECLKFRIGSTVDKVVRDGLGVD